MWIPVWMLIGIATGFLVVDAMRIENRKDTILAAFFGALVSGWVLTLFGRGETLIGLTFINFVLIVLGAVAAIVIENYYLNFPKVLQFIRPKFEKLSELSSQTTAAVKLKLTHPRI